MMSSFSLRSQSTLLNPRRYASSLSANRKPDRSKGGFRFSVFARHGEWVEHSTGHIKPCLARPASQIDRAAIAARCREREVLFDKQRRTKQERYIDFGPRWHSLKSLRIGKNEGLAELRWTIASPQILPPIACILRCSIWQQGVHST